MGSAAASSAASASACRKRALDEFSGDCSTTDELQDDVMHKVHIQLHSGQDAIRIQVNTSLYRASRASLCDVRIY